MHFSEYMDAAMRTRGLFDNERRFTAHEQQLLCGCLGLSGESGEFVDAVKKYFFHAKPIPDDILQKELGDVFWYAALICDAKGWNMDKIAGMNIEKLKARYPQGFSFEKANDPNRDQTKRNIMFSSALVNTCSLHGKSPEAHCVECNKWLQ